MTLSAATVAAAELRDMLAVANAPGGWVDQLDASAKEEAVGRLERIEEAAQSALFSELRSLGVDPDMMRKALS